MLCDLLAKLLINGTNCIVTGKAGTGKSTHLRKVILALRKSNVKLLIVAPTNHAARHLDGDARTVCSAFGLRETISAADLGLLNTILGVQNHRVDSAIREAQVIIFDEFAQRPELLSHMDAVAKRATGQRRQFMGGKTILCCGDARQAGNTGVSVFGPRHWLLKPMAPQVFILRTNRRQNEDRPFATFLESVCNDGPRKHISECVKRYSISHAEARQQILQGEFDVILALTNERCRKLQILRYGQTGWRLKMRVASNINNHKLEVFNGSTGVITSFVPNEWSIEEWRKKGWRLPDNARVASLVPNVQFDTLYEDDPGKQPITFPATELHCGRGGMTLRPEDVCTPDRFQGLTLEDGKMLFYATAEDVRSRSKTPGIGYLVVSRCRRSEQLKLCGFDPAMLKPPDDIVRFIKLMERLEADTKAKYGDYENQETDLEDDDDDCMDWQSSSEPEL